MSPRASILMTIYNAGPFLAPAVESALHQSLEDFELIVVENGSNDGSKEIIRNFALGDVRIHVVDLPQNIGRTPALNLALENAQGRYIAVLDADDLAMPERLARQVELLESQPDVVLVGSQVRIIDESGALLRNFTPPSDHTSLYQALAWTNPILHSSSMYRRSAAVAAGGYPRDYIYAQDFALWLELLKQGQVALINEPLAAVREHNSATRLTRNPAIAKQKYMEILQLFQTAQSLPGLSVETRKHGQINLARHHFFFAKELLQAGMPLSACIQAIQCFWAAPYFCLERILVRVLLVEKRVRSKLMLFANRSGS